MTQTAETTQDARRENLRQFMNNRGIEPGLDYDFDDLMGIVDDEAYCARYAAISYHETYTFLNLFDTADEACAYLAERLGADDSGGSIEGVIDLETNTKYRVDTKVVVSLGAVDTSGF